MNEKHSIYLYYYRDLDNVGDVISPFIVKSLTGNSIRYKTPRHKLKWKGVIKEFLKSIIYKKDYYSDYIFPFQRCLAAIGSILDYTNDRCVVWGAGFREYDSRFVGGKIYAVRGYLSRQKLPKKYEKVAIGDPALLLPIFMPIKKHNYVSEHKIAIVPHYRDYDDLYKRFSDRYDIIDVRTKDIYSFVRAVMSHDYILSSSLHGLIISHSYGVPALWISNKYIDSGPFKFHDYFSSVDIPKYDGFKNIDEILNDVQSYRSLFLHYSKYSLPQISISIIQNNLLKSFPYERL